MDFRQGSFEEIGLVAVKEEKEGQEAIEEELAGVRGTLISPSLSPSSGAARGVADPDQCAAGYPVSPDTWAPQDSPSVAWKNVGDKICWQGEGEPQQQQRQQPSSQDVLGPKPSTVGCSERRDPRRLVGARVRKLWHLGVAGGSRWFTGKITAHYDDDTWGDVYNVHYQEDNDNEELTGDEVALILIPEAGESTEAEAARVHEVAHWGEAAAQLVGPSTVAAAVGVISEANPFRDNERVPGCSGAGAAGARVYAAFIDVSDGAAKGKKHRHIFNHRFADVAGAAAARDILVRRFKGPNTPVDINFPANTPIEVLTARMGATAVPPPSVSVNEEVEAAAEVEEAAEEANETKKKKKKNGKDTRKPRKPRAVRGRSGGSGGGGGSGGAKRREVFTDASARISEYSHGISASPRKPRGGSTVEVKRKHVLDSGSDEDDPADARTPRAKRKRKVPPPPPTADLAAVPTACAAAFVSAAPIHPTSGCGGSWASESGAGVMMDSKLIFPEYAAYTNAPPAAPVEPSPSERQPKPEVSPPPQELPVKSTQKTVTGITILSLGPRHRKPPELYKPPPPGTGGMAKSDKPRKKHEPTRPAPCPNPTPAAAAPGTKRKRAVPPLDSRFDPITAGVTPTPHPSPRPLSQELAMCMSGGNGGNNNVVSGEGEGGVGSHGGGGGTNANPGVGHELEAAMNDLSSALEKANDMVGRGLITSDEYNKLKARMMEKLG